MKVAIFHPIVGSRVDKVVKEAFGTLVLISHRIEDRSWNLEYCVQSWSPFRTRDAIKLERVQ